MKDTYTRSATVVRVIDGDTLVVDLSLGWDIFTTVPVRLAGLNAREHNVPGGPEATDHLREVLPIGTAVVLQSLARDKYGRALSVVLGPRGEVNASLIAEDWAAPWDGTGNKADHVPPWPRP